MGSVMSDVECPNCKYEFASSDFYYRSGEEYIFCKKCGYSSSYLISKKDRESDKELSKCKFIYKKSGGFGCFTIMFDGGGTTGNFNSKKGIKEFEDNFKKGFKNSEGKSAVEVTYTFSKNGKWFMKDLIKNEIFPFEKLEILEKL